MSKIEFTLLASRTSSLQKELFIGEFSSDEAILSQDFCGLYEALQLEDIVFCLCDGMASASRGKSKRKE